MVLFLLHGTGTQTAWKPPEIPSGSCCQRNPHQLTKPQSQGDLQALLHQRGASLPGCRKAHAAGISQLRPCLPSLSLSRALTSADSPPSREQSVEQLRETAGHTKLFRCFEDLLTTILFWSAHVQELTLISQATVSLFSVSHSWLWDRKISWPKSFDLPQYLCFNHLFVCATWGRQHRPCIRVRLRMRKIQSHHLA